MTGFVSSERRLIERVEEYWNYLRRDRAFPSTADIDPVELGDDWCDCFVMSPSQPPEDAAFLFIGPRLLENARLPESWSKDAERHVRDCPPGSMIARSVRYVDHVLQQRIPVKVSEVFEERDEEVRLRGTLFPLSSDGERIDAVLGAANCARLEDLRVKQPAA
ncbi:PAS domain-containing protein [Pelagibius marinus]|uniref:PAS domain-containing protein n=1 Tax=Pelagibius marinus TaxID=2762760 RepID=UPI0018727E71|nr:PAS domain-containing protein [Pelagibius marinus]